MTPGKGLIFTKRREKGIKLYTDVDWAGCVIDRKSTSGHCTYVWSNLVTWKSKKQSVVARNLQKPSIRPLLKEFVK